MTGPTAAHDMQAIVALTEHEDEEPKVVDLGHSKELTREVRKEILIRALETEDMENEKFLEKVQARLERYLPLQPSVQQVCIVHSP